MIRETKRNRWHEELENGADFKKMWSNVKGAKKRTKGENREGESISHRGKEYITPRAKAEE